MSPSRPAISLSRSATKGSYKVKGWIDLFKRSLKTLKTHRMLLSPSFSSLGVKPSTMYITKASTVLYRTRVSQDKLLEKSLAGFTQVLSPDKIDLFSIPSFLMLFCESLFPSVSNWVKMHYHLNDIMPRTSITISMVCTQDNSWNRDKQQRLWTGLLTEHLRPRISATYFNTVGSFLVSQPPNDTVDS